MDVMLFVSYNIIYKPPCQIQMNQQPQSCTKCGKMPQDILMLACGHDLCLNCASDRLAFQMKKNKNANVIVCQQCYEKTPLDGESVDVLKSMMRTQPLRSYGDPNKISDFNNETKYKEPYINETNERNQNKYSYNKTSSLGIDRGIDKEKGYSDRAQGSKVSASKGVSNEWFQDIPSKKSCGQHPDQQILYFCFDCKCQCICPECIIHGKHKDHDVKTVRKSQPLIKTEMESYINKFENNIEGLLIKTNQLDKQIRNLTEQNNVSKRQIQQAFEDLRVKINSKQKELLSSCDQALSQILAQLQRISTIMSRKIDDLKSFSSAMLESTKREQILFLNFYSRRWKQIKQQLKQPDMLIPSIQLPSNQSILSQILDANDQITRLGALLKPNKTQIGVMR